jgi:hypothetical protein
MLRVCSLVGLCVVALLWAIPADADEAIQDPELDLQGDPASATACTRAAATSEVHLTLHTRANRDLRDESPREETWESTTQLALDATLRRSDELRFGVGLVGRYHVA